MPHPPVDDREDPQRRRERELGELLQELRVVLPGVQFLFGFLLTVPFDNGFKEVTSLEKGIFFVALAAAAAATVFLMAPPVNHRLRWREHDRERLLQTSNRNTIIGTTLLALAITAALFVVTSFIFATGPAVATAVAIAALTAIVWYLVPIFLRHTDSSS